MEVVPGEPLLACHVDLKNASWYLRLPNEFKQTYAVEIDGDMFAFDCLPFGWQFSPPPPPLRDRPGFFLNKFNLVLVSVLHYLDDFHFVGYGADNVPGVVPQLCVLLREKGPSISPKSVLDPAPSIVWPGQHHSPSRMV